MSTLKCTDSEIVALARINKSIKFMISLYKDERKEAVQQATPYILAFIAGLVLRGRIVSTVTNDGNVSRNTVRGAHQLLKTFLNQCCPADEHTFDIAGVRFRSFEDRHTTAVAGVRRLIFEEVDKYYGSKSIIHSDTLMAALEGATLIGWVETLGDRIGLLPADCNVYSLARLMRSKCMLRYTEEVDVTHFLLLKNVPKSVRITVVIDDHFSAEKAQLQPSKHTAEGACAYRLDPIDRDLGVKYPRPGIIHSVAVVMEPVTGIFVLDVTQPEMEVAICKLPVFTRDVPLSRKLELSRDVCIRTPSDDWYARLKLFEYESEADQHDDDVSMINVGGTVCPYTLESPIVDAVVSVQCKGVHPFSLRNFQTIARRRKSLLQPWRCPVCTVPFLPNHLRKYMEPHGRERLFACP